MNQIKLPNNKSIIVETSELIELARLSYLVERYQFMFQQRQKRKLINSYDEYLEKTSPLIDYYESKNLLIRINNIDANIIFDKVSSLVRKA